MTEFYFSLEANRWKKIQQGYGKTEMMVEYQGVVEIQLSDLKAFKQQTVVNQKLEKAKAVGSKEGHYS